MHASRGKERRDVPEGFDTARGLNQDLERDDGVAAHGDLILKYTG